MISDKGALALLADYGGDSSDDDVPGCRVSTKRLYKSENENSQNKRLKKLPVPDFALFNNNTEEVIDDPSVHEGRIRSFPHERGNWATYVYIPYEMTEGLQRLLPIVTNTFENVDMKCFNEFHISLTRTVILKYHWIDSFIDSIREHISHFTKFIVMIDSLEVYCNEEKTRTFLGLKIITGYDTLLKLVSALDNCLSEFKLSKFYENPSFHVSIAWCLGNHVETIRTLLPILNKELEGLMKEFSQENWYIYVEEILCKTGNKLFQFQLK